MRTHQEILERAREVSEFDMFGFSTGDLVSRLPFDLAREFLKDDAESSEWEVSPADRENVQGELIDYMEFAWGKANNRRGLSSMRSLMHMHAWLWLMGEDDFLTKHDLYEYTHYGKPHLAAICDHLNINWRQWDDDRWTNEESFEGVPAEEIYDGLKEGD